MKVVTTSGLAPLAKVGHSPDSSRFAVAVAQAETTGQTKRHSGCRPSKGSSAELSLAALFSPLVVSFGHRQCHHPRALFVRRWLLRQRLSFALLQSSR